MFTVLPPEHYTVGYSLPSCSPDGSGINLCGYFMQQISAKLSLKLSDSVYLKSFQRDGYFIHILLWLISNVFIHLVPLCYYIIPDNKSVLIFPILYPIKVTNEYLFMKILS